MNAVLNTLKVSASKRVAALALAAGGACLTLGAPPAQAGEFRAPDNHTVIGVDFEFNNRYHGVRERDDERCEPGYAFRETKVWCEPVYRTVCDKVWVEPVYRTVCEKVYRAPVTRTVCEKVWVPDRYETRTVVRREGRGRVVRCEERVLIERGHYATVERVVEVIPGRWENEERRVLVCDGHFDNVERRELITPGRYEVRRERVRVADRYERRGGGEDFRIGFEWRKH
jgi:hypothetical protein